MSDTDYVRDTRNRVIVGAVFVGVVSFFVLLLVWGLRTLPSKAGDPRDGPVKVNNGVTKQCDGPNLVYIATGAFSRQVTVVPDSPECG